MSWFYNPPDADEQRFFCGVYGHNADNMDLLCTCGLPFWAHIFFCIIDPHRRITSYGIGVGIKACVR